MKKTMKKTITVIILVATMILGASSAYANMSAIDEARSIKLQADSLIASVDKESLLMDAIENVIDYSVPLSVRESIFTSVDFIPVNGVAHDEVKLEVNSTIKKVGEIVHKNGEISNMYVAAVIASDEKVDEGFIMVLGIKAWTYVYWIDNFGTKNQLVAAAADWDPKDKVVDNRVVRYGTSDPTLTIWYSSTTKYPTSNSVKYNDSSYTGLTLRCQSKIDVVNVGTVTCNVGSSIFTR